MIPHLWQCEDPAWWELLLGAPTTLTGLLVLVSVWLLLSTTTRWLRASRILLQLLVTLVAAIAGLALFGVAVGQVLRGRSVDPSVVYESMRWAIVGAGWPILLGGVGIALARDAGGNGTNAAGVHSASKPTVPGHTEGSRARRRGMASLLLLLAPGWLVLSYSSIPWIRTLRSWVAVPVEVLGARFATSECLAEQMLERSSDDVPLLLTMPGQIELSFNRQANLREVGWRALRSYRKKVRNGRVTEPKTLFGVLCSESAEQQRELLTWSNDPGQSPGSRALAREAYRQASEGPTRHPECR